MKIPWQTLSAEALQGLIQEFVTREGTEYGMQEVSLAAKVAQVKNQLASGEVTLVFDIELQSASIVLTDELPGQKDAKQDNY